ncbi:MAG: nuclear transport factor 2 family protein [Novosphingobium sp.]|nr:nuclear transport factor 2 family protein [Novosphingobium sp.]
MNRTNVHNPFGLNQEPPPVPHDLETLAARLQMLEDREAIREIIARYGPLADRGDAPALAALWEEDGTYEVTGFATARGRAEIAALIDAPYHRELMAGGCAHVLGPVAVTLSANSATAVGHSLVFRHHEGTFSVLRVSANRWTLRRDPHDGQWRVPHRANALLDGAEAARMLLSGPVGAP